MKKIEIVFISDKFENQAEAIDFALKQFLHGHKEPLYIRQIGTYPEYYVVRLLKPADKEIDNLPGIPKFKTKTYMKYLSPVVPIYI